MIEYVRRNYISLIDDMMANPLTDTLRLGATIDLAQIRSLLLADFSG